LKHKKTTQQNASITKHHITQLNVIIANINLFKGLPKEKIEENVSHLPSFNGRCRYN
jgi:hypothetical protein